MIISRLLYDGGTCTQYYYDLQVQVYNTLNGHVYFIEPTVFIRGRGICLQHAAAHGGGILIYR